MLSDIINLPMTEITSTDFFTHYVQNDVPLHLLIKTILHITVKLFEHTDRGLGEEHSGKCIKMQ